MAEGYDVNTEFKRAVYLIQKWTGLEQLTLSESVALRLIVKDAVERINKVKSPFDKFHPASEATARFMYDYYGVPMTFVDANRISLLRRDLGVAKGYDVVGEYFRRKQEEYNLI